MDEAGFIAAMREAMRKHGISQAAVATAAGLTSQSAVSNILNGTRRIKIDERTRIGRFLGIEEDAKVQWVPVIGLASAGAWQEAILMPVRERPIPLRVAGKRAFAVEIVGDSMNMLLPEGGYAIVDPDQTSLYSGKVYLLENEDRDTTVKRYRGDPARFEPVSTNPTHEPLDLANVPFRVIGRIVSYGNDEGL